MTVAIDNGRMIKKFPIFKGTDGECCATLKVTLLVETPVPLPDLKKYEGHL